MKKLLIAASFAAAGAALCTRAQDMGGEPDGQAAAIAAEAPAAESAQAAATTPPDDGLKIVVDAQQQKPAEADDADDADDPTATMMVQNMLAGLDAEGNPVPGKPKFIQGYDPKRRSIIHIGTAMAPVPDPSKSLNYIKVRQMLAQEAVMNAKVKIIRQLRQEMSATEAIAGSDSQEAEAFKKKHAEEYARLETQRLKVQSLIAELDDFLRAEGF